jgi:glycosyltransferase involved in cell wall biosynthesis
MKNPIPKIAIIIPSYNEERVIQPVIQSIPQDVKANGKSYSLTVIVVNDGSTDNTPAIAKREKRIVLINHLINSGAGAATRTGLEYAIRTAHDYAITMDADGQHQSQDVIKLINEVTKDQYDFIIGSRLINSKGMPWYRVFGNKLLSLITFFMFGVFVTDSQSGLKALNKKALRNLTYYSNRFAFCSEMIWRAQQNGLSITEIPIKAIYTDYSLNKGQRNWDVIHILKHLLKQRLMEFING